MSTPLLVQPLPSTASAVALAVGPSKPNDASELSWRLFDDSTKWKAFSQRGLEDQWSSHVKVQGMHCSACSARVEQALLQVPGVISAKVDAISSRAQIVWRESAVKPSQWLSAVASAGYALLPVQGLDALAQAKAERRTMLWRWLVAGFCMMQVMMYSWPYYGAVAGDIDPTSDQLLRWASLLLTLPVLLFSSGPFFRAAWQDLVHARVSMDLPVALGISLTFAISTVAVMYPTSVWGGELYFDSLTMLVFFLLSGRWLELRLKHEVAGQIELGAGLLPVTAELMSESQGISTVPVQSLSIGDVIFVRTGEAFAADGTVTHGQSDAEESLLTGEAMPVLKTVGDSVFAGTTNLSSPLKVRLTKLDADTRLGQMNQLMQKSLYTKPQIVQLADRVAKPFLIVVLLLALFAVLFWWPSDPPKGVLAAIAVLVVTCPCALALAAPTAFLASASGLAQRGLLVRDLAALERLDLVDHFAFDKTGTLTQSELAVESLEAANGFTTGQVLALSGVLASQSMHAVSRAVSRYVTEQGDVQDGHPKATQIQEFAGFGVEGLIEATTGQPNHYKLGSARFCGVTPQMNAQNRRAVYLSSGEKLAGIFYLHESLRPDADVMMSRLKAALQAKASSLVSHLSILSGDSRQSVLAIADKLRWDHVHDQIISECSAADKLGALERLRSHGLTVAMVGDGINDSPVLAAADVSFAPAQGAALASVKADFLLTSQSLAPIADARVQASRTMQIVRQNLAWSLAYNLCCVPLALAGVLTPWMAGLGMAASSIVVLMNSLRLRRVQE